MRPVREPLGMSGGGGVCGRALEGYVECEDDARLRRDLDEPAEVVEGAELRVDRLMPTLLRAYGPRTARLAGLRRLVVGSLALGLADGMDRREVEGVEAQAWDLGQATLPLAKRSMVAC